jgi:hypothetical protein
MPQRQATIWHTHMKAHLNQKPSMTVRRDIIKKSKIVYLLVGPVPTKYRDGKSRIVYIGMTRKGTSRIASSVAHRAEEILETKGFRKMEVHVVSCGKKTGLKSWQYLEKALLAAFRGYYQELPHYNKQGKKLRWTRKLNSLFRRSAIEDILMHFNV